MTDLRDRGFALRVSQDADKLEFAAIRGRSAVLTSSVMDASFSGAFDDFEHSLDDAVHEAWQQKDLEVEDAVSYVISEIERRMLLLGSAYPFQLTGTTLAYTGPTSLTLYEFCLAIMRAPNVTTGEYRRLPRVFERVVSVLVAAFLGINAQSLHVGTPRDEAVGVLFADAMNTLCGRTRDFTWGPEEEYIAQAASAVRDEGVDFIAWTAPDEVRPGSVYVIGQCACGNTIEDKYTDVSLARLKRWFRRFPVVPPIRAFATPLHLPDMNLIEAQRDAGVVFDRARLVLTAERNDGMQRLCPFKRDMDELTALVLSSV